MRPADRFVIILTSRNTISPHKKCMRANGMREALGMDAETGRDSGWVIDNLRHLPHTHINLNIEEEDLRGGNIRCSRLSKARGEQRPIRAGMRESYSMVQLRICTSAVRKWLRRNRMGNPIASDSSRTHDSAHLVGNTQHFWTTHLTFAVQGLRICPAPCRELQYRKTYSTVIEKEG